MKLLFICESFPTSAQADITGGVEARDFFIARHLAPRHHLTVITNARHGSPKSQTIQGINIIRLGLATGHHNRQQPLVRVVFFFAALIHSLKTDFELIQASNAFTQLVAFLAGSLKAKPKVALIPDIYIGSWIKHTGWFTGIIGEILERTSLFLPWNKIISWSLITQQKLIDYGVPASRIQVIYGGVDVVACQNIQASKTKNPTIAFAARLVHYKQAEVLVQATSRLKQVLPSVKVEIIGDGPEKKALVKLVKKLGLGQNVILRGFVKSHRQVMATIKRSWIFCLPSKVEGFGLVTVEAMACGTPYVNSRIPPTVEITRNGRGGLLFKPGDDRDLARKIINLVQDQNLYRQKRQEGLELAKDYDWQQIGTQTEKLFASLIV